MILNKLKNLRWKYVTGELALIFIGITISLYFDRWNENRKEREVELKLLKELSQNLDDDLYTIDFTKVTTKKAISSDSTLFMLMHKVADFNDQENTQILELLPNVTDYAAFGFSNSSYIAFQNAGLSIISKDSIRLLLTQYNDMKPIYLYDYERITNHINQRFHPIIEVNFRKFKPFVEATPWSLTELKHSREFIGALNRKINLQQSFLQTFMSLRNEVSHLQNIVNREIKQRM